MHEWDDMLPLATNSRTDYVSIDDWRKRMLIGEEKFGDNVIAAPRTHDRNGWNPSSTRISAAGGMGGTSVTLRLVAEGKAKLAGDNAAINPLASLAIGHCIVLQFRKVADKYNGRATAGGGGDMLMLRVREIYYGTQDFARVKALGVGTGKTDDGQVSGREASVSTRNVYVVCIAA